MEKTPLSIAVPGVIATRPVMLQTTPENHRTVNVFDRLPGLLTSQEIATHQARRAICLKFRVLVNGVFHDIAFHVLNRFLTQIARDYADMPLPV